MRHKNPVLIASWLAIAALVTVASGQTSPDFRSISKAEIEMLLQDVAKSNPMVLKRLAEDPEMKKQQVDNLRQLLAFATQAQNDGLTDDPVTRQELENIRSEVTAVSYDREINVGKGPMPPLGFISEARVKAFWIASPTAKETEFQTFLETKTALLRAGAPGMKDREITEEEKEQARDFFAKIEIYDAEYKGKHLSLPKTFRDKVDIQIKLQQAQFLARLYSEKMALRMKATDAEIEKYISGHPELDTTKKKAKAEQILNRAKAGEDFPKLANEFSEDPGNKSTDGKFQGGLYSDVPVGMMVPPFERAALALKPGEISPGVVESDYGYHIIKLEKRGSNPADPKTEIYDVRHILISTGVKDPDSPLGADKPVKLFVREKLENEKEKAALDALIKANNIQVAEDFTIPVRGTEPPTVKKVSPSKKKKVVRKRR